MFFKGYWLNATNSPDTTLVCEKAKTDALRFDHLGIYGYEEPTSPFIDSLGADGVVFEHAFSHGSETFRSTAALLTSKYVPQFVERPAALDPISELPQETAERHSGVPMLGPLNLTLAEALVANGYQTVGLFTNPHHHSKSP